MATAPPPPIDGNYRDGETDTPQGDATGWPEYLHSGGTLFAVFMIAYPILSIGHALFFERLIYLSGPLMLLFFCGCFALRMSLALYRRQK